MTAITSRVASSDFPKPRKAFQYDASGRDGQSSNRAAAGTDCFLRGYGPQEASFVAIMPCIPECSDVRAPRSPKQTVPLQTDHTEVISLIEEAAKLSRKRFQSRDTVAAWQKVVESSQRGGSNLRIVLGVKLSCGLSAFEVLADSGSIEAIKAVFSGMPFGCYASRISNSKYTIGTVRDNQLNGVVSVNLPNGFRYEGESSCGQCTGLGTATWPNREAVYAGRVEKFLPEGEGIMSYKGKDYRGIFASKVERSSSGDRIAKISVIKGPDRGFKISLSNKAPIDYPDSSQQRSTEGSNKNRVIG